MAKAATISSQVLQDKFYCRLFSQVSLTRYKDTDRSIASVRGAPERDAVEREIGIPTICVCFLRIKLRNIGGSSLEPRLHSAQKNAAFQSTAGTLRGGRADQEEWNPEG
jgi:hypothetical protein